MSYFIERQEEIRLPLSARDDSGLRRGQLGALHALSAAYSLDRRRPSIVVMPTGSGKTGVMMITPFLVGANRVLIVTPSRLVRSQITEEFQTMRLLRRMGLLADIPGPRVKEIEKRLSANDDWENLRKFDVVITTPNSSSPAYELVSDPPEDLFDLVLVDEAHHSPSRTWNGLLDAFPTAKRVLFTATPFRRDEAEIRGEFAYVYPIEEAMSEGIFRRIDFIPVPPAENSRANDIAVAKMAEKVFISDREAGLHHSIMVRTDVKKRADELANLYEEHTSLRLKKIHSGLHYSTIKRTIEKLKTFELDGVICVDMLGEGFDFPNLKVAAVHAPHHSLAVTLQFIGRFARGGSPLIGTAKFLAVENDIRVESVELYEEGAAWQHLVPNLLTSGIGEEVRTKRVLDTFASWQSARLEDEIQDLSLYTLHPYHHIVAYNVHGPVNLDASLDLGVSRTVEHRWTSEVQSAAVFITKERVRPRWTNLNIFPSVRHDLFIVYSSKDGQFLFISSTDRGNDSLYEQLAQRFSPSGARRVSQDTAQKALLGLTDHELFMVGMRNQSLNHNSESYRMIAGPTANRGVRPTDGRAYLQGHSFGRARDSGREVTIGWSGQGKVWSNTTSRLPDFLDWCETVARRFASSETVRTSTELDFLPMGSRITSIPPHPISANWDEGAFIRPWIAKYVSVDGNMLEAQISNLHWQIDHQRCSSDEIRLMLMGHGVNLPVSFRLDNGPKFGFPEGDSYRMVLERGRSIIPLLDYLNVNPLSFFFWDFSYLVGDLYSPSQSGNLTAFDMSRVLDPGWFSAGVDITKEFGDCDNGKISIHRFLEQRLMESGAQVVFYDHASKEIADFITIDDDVQHITCTFYHCKASSRPAAGVRVADLYDVCGQVQKSLRWVNDNQRLVERLIHRATGRGDRLLRGDIDTLSKFLDASKQKRTTYRISIVQPGLDGDGDSEDIQKMLAATDDYISRWGCENLHVMGSRSGLVEAMEAR